MTTELQTYRERRLVPLRWKRARHGPAHPDYPDIDDRGTRAPEFAPIVGIMEETQVYVRVVRELIAADAPLFVTSSEPGVVRVTAPEGGMLPAGPHADIQLEGIVGGDPNQVHVEVHFGAPDGPVVTRLVARCFKALDVRIVAHVMTVTNYDGSNPKTAITDIRTLMRSVNAVYQPCGIRFHVAEIVKETYHLSDPENVSDGDQRNMAEKLNRKNVMNVYQIHRIGNGNDVGGTDSRKRVMTEPTLKYTVPSVGVADQALYCAACGTEPVYFDNYDQVEHGMTLAHEIGHFLTLGHVDLRDDVWTFAGDFWARRNIMFRVWPLPSFQDWRDDTGYGRNRGLTRAGGLVTHKQIPTVAGDNQCTRARQIASSRILY
jgi:hypothetical protein